MNTRNVLLVCATVLLVAAMCLGTILVLGRQPRVVEVVRTVEVIAAPEVIYVTATPKPTTPAVNPPAPTAAPAEVTITYQQFDAGEITIPTGYSLNTGEITNYGGKAYVNTPDQVYYIINDTNHDIKVTTVGGGLANSVDVDRLVNTELVGGCDPNGCNKVYVIYASGKADHIYTK